MDRQEQQERRIRELWGQLDATCRLALLDFAETLLREQKRSGGKYTGRKR